MDDEPHGKAFKVHGGAKPAKKALTADHLSLNCFILNFVFLLNTIQSFES
jgi:hypothetical protein